MDRFTRVEQLLGKKTAKRLAGARIAVFGLGAVGSFAVESLARTGIGYFVLIDFDVVRASNFNRQIYALESSLGKPKVQIARDRILEINPECVVEIYPEFAAQDNYERLLTPAPDIVVDAIDSVNPKTQLIAYCVNQKIPVVSSMGAGDKTDPSMIRVGDLAESSVCPLARRIRKRLRKYDVSTGPRCVYSTEIPKRTRPAVREEEFHPRGRQRQPVGTISYMTGIFGLMVASEVIRIWVAGATQSGSAGKSLHDHRSGDRPFP